jgi:hypothetical protein
VQFTREIDVGEEIKAAAPPRRPAAPAAALVVRLLAAGSPGGLFSWRARHPAAVRPGRAFRPPEAASRALRDAPGRRFPSKPPPDAAAPRRKTAADQRLGPVRMRSPYLHGRLPMRWLSRVSSCG